MRLWVLLGLTACMPSLVNLGDDTDTDIDDGGAGYEGGEWTETLCDPLADLASQRARYDSGELRRAVEALTDARYPVAREFIDAQDDGQLETWFRHQGTATFDAMVGGYEVAVHEGSHIFDFRSLGGGQWRFKVADGVYLSAARQDSFARSAILDRHADVSSDFYADIYLRGDSGSQGFDNLLSEYNAYTHSLVTRYCTRDFVEGSTSARDGILTMMYYVELYLQIAREEHAADYARIVGDAGTREVVLTVWDRAEFWLDLTSSMPALGLRDDQIEAWVRDPALLGEIRRVAEADAD